MKLSFFGNPGIPAVEGLAALYRGTSDGMRLSDNSNRLPTMRTEWGMREPLPLFREIPEAAEGLSHKFGAH